MAHGAREDDRGSDASRSQDDGRSEGNNAGTTASLPGRRPFLAACDPAGWAQAVGRSCLNAHACRPSRGIRRTCRNLLWYGIRSKAEETFIPIAGPDHLGQRMI
jgi:hypothetical protein